MNLLRKATAAAIMGVKKITGDFAKDFCAKYPKGQMYLIAGICSEVRSGMHAQFGLWYEFGGEFRIRRIGGGEFMATRAFLPEPCLSMILQGIKVARDAVPSDKDSPPVKGEKFEFVYVVGIRPTSTTMGFEYTSGTLQAPKPSDAMANLLESVDANTEFPALPDAIAGQKALASPVATDAIAGQKALASPVATDVPGQTKMPDSPPHPAPTSKKK